MGCVASLLGASLAANGRAQSATREVTTTTAKATTVSVKLQPPPGNQPVVVGGRALFLMAPCIDDEDVSCFPVIRIRLDPDDGELSEGTSVQMWLMRLDGASEMQPVTVLPSHPAGAAHWQLGREYQHYKVLPWSKAHPPWRSATEQIFQFRVAFDGGTGQSMPFRLVQLSSP
ncbi:MAG: hypothetical protein JWM41_1119 [Gemmatimonadetes bacterium]|nr:hypothetical protein [Gemmatimonadota bacterium]